MANPDGRGPEFDDPAVRKRLLKSIRNGAPYHMAAAAAGVCENAFMKWKAAGAAAQAKQGRGEPLTERDMKYLQLLHDIKAAEAEGCDVILARIQRASRIDKHWPAGAWLLERRHPNEYGRRLALEDVTANDDNLRLQRQAEAEMDRAMAADPVLADAVARAAEAEAAIFARLKMEQRDGNASATPPADPAPEAPRADEPAAPPCADPDSTPCADPERTP